jgi:hypothetical protein
MFGLIAKSPYRMTKVKGTEIQIYFDPSVSKLAKCCFTIWLSQVLQIYEDGKPVMPGKHNTFWKYRDAWAVGNGAHIDAGEKATVPYYQSTLTDRSVNYPGRKTENITKESAMNDQPRATGGNSGYYHEKLRPNGVKEIVYSFEVFAWCGDGEDRPKFYEGIKWEYRRTWEQWWDKDIDEGDVLVTNYNLEKPSATFLEAFEKFNKVKGFKP